MEGFGLPAPPPLPRRICEAVEASGGETIHAAPSRGTDERKGVVRARAATPESIEDVMPARGLPDHLADAWRYRRGGTEGSRR